MSSANDTTFVKPELIQEELILVPIEEEEEIQTDKNKEVEIRQSLLKDYEKLNRIFDELILKIERRKANINK